MSNLYIITRPDICRHWVDGLSDSDFILPTNQKAFGAIFREDVCQGQILDFADYIDDFELAEIDKNSRNQIFEWKKGRNSIETINQTSKFQRFLEIGFLESIILKVLARYSFSRIIAPLNINEPIFEVLEKLKQTIHVDFEIMQLSEPFSHYRIQENLQENQNLLKYDNVLVSTAVPNLSRQISRILESNQSVLVIVDRFLTDHIDELQRRFANCKNVGFANASANAINFYELGDNERYCEDVFATIRRVLQKKKPAKIFLSDNKHIENSAAAIVAQELAIEVIVIAHSIRPIEKIVRLEILTYEKMAYQFNNWIAKGTLRKSLSFAKMLWRSRRFFGFKTKYLRIGVPVTTDQLYNFCRHNPSNLVQKIIEISNASGDNTFINVRLRALEDDITYWKRALDGNEHIKIEIANEASLYDFVACNDILIEAGGRSSISYHAISNLTPYFVLNNRLDIDGNVTDFDTLSTQLSIVNLSGEISSLRKKSRRFFSAIRQYIRLMYITRTTN